MNAPIGVLQDSSALSFRLKSETRDAHDYTEGLLFSRQLLDGSLALEHYVEHLASHYCMHAVMESSLQVAGDPRVSLVWEDRRSKLENLRADLRHFGRDTNLRPPVQRAVDDFGGFVRELRRSEPLSLIGVFYVFEGSTLGGAFLKPRIAEMYELETEGVRYYSGYGRHTGSTWKAFRTALDTLPLTEPEVTALTRAASDTFVHVGHVLDAIVS